MQRHNLIEEMKLLGITHITADSRKVESGSAFFAVSEKYIDEAIRRRARLVISSGFDPRAIIVPDVRIALAEAAEYLYPEVPDHLVAVTGTSGKTSIVNYFMQICQLLGHKAAAIGSLGVKCTDKKLEQELTRKDDLNTPDIVTMRKILSTLKKEGVDLVAFEGSSHGIDQKRIYGVKIEAAGFTNLSHDHLDYHKTMKAYLEAKLKLFSENLVEGGRIIVSSELKKYFATNNKEIIVVGASGDISITSTEQSARGQKVGFTYLGKGYSFLSGISGGFQANNLLIATALVDKALGNFDEIIKVLPKVTGVRGRFERVTNPNYGYQVFVDYSHKPAALESVLSELKVITNGKLIVVFGCGGDRDREKRPIMGRIANKLADIVIVTDDNPRSEDAGVIRSEITSSAPNAIEIGDREEAIRIAIEQARNGDIVLIAGKGHETYQIIGDKKLPFDDYEIAKKYIGTK